MKVGFWLFSSVHSRPETASSRIRGTWLIKYWEGAEELHYGHKYDAVVFQKVYEVPYAKVFDGVKILDICDPDYLDNKIPFMEMVELCDAVTVSTIYLQRAIQGWTKKPVVMIPDRHDLEYFKERKIHRGRAREVCWFGYSHNASSLKSIKEYLIEHNLGISIISDQPFYLSEYLSDKSLKNVINERYTKWELATVNKEIIKSDFVVMPGSRNPNSRFKSNNKTIHSYLLRMPVAVCVEELERFLDPIERQKEADEKHQFAVQNYDIKISVQAYKNLIEKLRKEKNDKFQI